jgi:hypothetical protein
VIDAHKFVGHSFVGHSPQHGQGEIDMTTLTQGSSSPSLKQPAATGQIISKQVVTEAAPSGPASAPKTGGRVAAPRSHKLTRWLIGLALLILAVGAGLVWVHATGVDVRASLAAAWQRLTGSEVPEGTEPATPLCYDLPNHTAPHVGQTEVSALVAIG